MRLRQETIAVKGGDAVTADVWESDYGVVQVFDTEHDRAFAFHRAWDGFEIQTLMAWIRSTQAQDYGQWLDAAEDVATTINWYYADRDGNIGYVSPGYRRCVQASQDLRLPAKGDGSMDWTGVRPFADVPKTFNPEQGWIANWNNRSQGIVWTASRALRRGGRVRVSPGGVPAACRTRRNAASPAWRSCAVDGA